MARRKSFDAIWAREVQKAMNAPAPPTTQTREQIEADIAAITAELKGPLSNVDRLDLVEARAARRKQLAAMTGAAS